MSKITINRKLFSIIAIIYLLVPVAIFLLGFIKLYFAIPFVAVLIASGVIYVRDINNDKDRNLLKDSGISISLTYLVVAGVLTVLLCLISGIGEFTWSTIDHRVRWVILKDLVDYKWPVIYDFSTQENPLVREILGEGKAAFAYYYTFWMIPALVGKIFGLTAARVTLVAWSSLGMYLLLIGIGLWEEKIGWITLVVLALFGGLDTIPYHTEVLMGVERTWEGWNDQLYIHGSYSQLMNVFHQSIPGWLVTLLLVSMKNNRSVGFIGSLMFCYSPWATIGLVPIAICQLLRKDLQSADTKSHLVNIFGFNNLVVPAIILLVFAPFYTANPEATSVRGLTWNFIQGSVAYKLMCFALYIVVEFGIWMIIVYKDYKKEPLFWMVLAEMLILPLYNISAINDFLMRSSMAPMFILMLMVIKAVDKAVINLKKRDNNRDSIIGLLVLLVMFLSSLTQIDLLTASINFTMTDMESANELRTEIGSFGNINDEGETAMVDLQFLVENYEESLFYKYLAR